MLKKIAVRLFVAVSVLNLGLVAYLAQDHFRHPPATVSAGAHRNLSPQLADLQTRLRDVKAAVDRLAAPPSSDAIAGALTRESAVDRRLEALEINLRDLATEIGPPNASGYGGLDPALHRVVACLRSMIDAYDHHEHAENRFRDQYSDAYTEPPTSLNQVSCPLLPSWL